MNQFDAAKRRLIDAVAAWHVDGKTRAVSMRVNDALCDLDRVTNGALTAWAIRRTAVAYADLVSENLRLQLQLAEERERAAAEPAP